MADLRIKYTERMVGANHPTLSDTLNRLLKAEHGNDGSHIAEHLIKAHLAAFPQTTIILGGPTPPSQDEMDLLMSWGMAENNIIWADTGVLD